MGSLEIRHETWRELLGIGLVAGDLSPETIARCAQVSRHDVNQAFALARSSGVLGVDDSIAPDHASRLVDDLASDVVSGVHATMTRHLLSAGPDLLTAAVTHARQVTTQHDVEAVVALCDHFGEVNVSLGAYSSARVLLEVASELDLSADDGRQGRRLLMLARAIDGVGDVVGARALMKQAVVLGERAGDLSLIVDAACRHVLPADWNSGDQETLGLLQRVSTLHLDEDQQSRLLAARSLAEMRIPTRIDQGQQVAWVTRPEVARPLADRALGQSVHLSPETRAMALLAWRSAHRAPDYLSRRREVSEELVALANTLRRADLQVEGALYLAVDALESGSRPDYERALGVIRWVAASDGNPRLRWRADTLAAGAAYLDDELDEADRLVAQADEIGTAIGSPRLANTKAFFAAQRAVTRDDHQSLISLQLDDSSPLLQNPLTGAVVAWCLARSRHVDKAEQLVQRALHHVDGDASGLFLLTRLSDAALALGSARLCGDLAERLGPWGSHISVDSNAWWCDGPVALWLALLHECAGNTTPVGDLLEQATLMVDVLGDARSRRRLRNLERARGRTSAQEPDHELSSREVQVLRLMSRGATNAEIAAELGYSLSTIRHASMVIYRKLSVTRRSEAVVRAYALRLLVPGSES